MHVFLKPTEHSTTLTWLEVLREKGKIEEQMEVAVLLLSPLDLCLDLTSTLLVCPSGGQSSRQLQERLTVMLNYKEIRFLWGCGGRRKQI